MTEPAAGPTSAEFQPAMSYSEIARELGLSVERVRQIERKAMDKLRVQIIARRQTRALLEHLR